MLSFYPLISVHCTQLICLEAFVEVLRQTGNAVLQTIVADVVRKCGECFQEILQCPQGEVWKLFSRSLKSVHTSPKLVDLINLNISQN